MPRIDRTLEGPDQTARLGEELAGLLRPGDVVALVGELGAGKTTLVRAIAIALGVDASLVSSPTFVLMNVYPRDHDAPILHLDAYRVGAPEDLDATGWRDLAANAITLIEWADRVEAAVPPGALRLRIEHMAHDSRRAIIQIPDPWNDRPGLGALAGRRETICPITGQRVPGDSPTWPFAHERARMADLGRWFSGRYSIGRPVEPDDPADS